MIRNSGPGVLGGAAAGQMRVYGAPGVIEQPERRSRGVMIHGFRNPNTVPRAITAMSAVGGKADVIATWSESLLIAEGVEKIGADRFCATIVPVGCA